MLKDTQEFRLGRATELLCYEMYGSVQFAQLDIAAATARGAPLVRSWEGAFVAADSLMVRRGIFLHEIKYKSKAGESGGGPRPDPDGPCPAGWIPRGERFHCIERPNFHSYRQQARKFKLPLILSVVTLDRGWILAASLRDLGEPYPCLRPDERDVVNFPERRFTVLWELDQKRLVKFYREPLEKLTPKRMRLFVDWLRPRQAEFAFFRERLITECENQWRQP